MDAWKKICCAVDFSDASRAAMQQAACLARHLGATLTLLHVMVSRGATGRLELPEREDGRLNLQEFELLSTWCKDAERHAGRPVRSVVVSGDPSTAIVQLAEDEECDLVVLGTHGRTGLAHLVLGSVAERVARRAPCPVLLVRAHEVLELRADEEELALYR